MAETNVQHAGILVRLGRTEEVIDLRHACLRQGLPRDSAAFDGDEEPATLHAVADLSNRIIGCATLLQRPWNAAPAWQLRGMAVDSAYQCFGLGRRLLAVLEDAVQLRGFSPQLWCNARVPASGFYERVGWTVASDVFDIPTAGPHVKMTKRLRSREDEASDR